MHGVKDHTFNLAEGDFLKCETCYNFHNAHAYSIGGYVFLETEAGKLSASRMFSPEFNADETHCLTFFFATAYNSPNTTLTVYR